MPSAMTLRLLEPGRGVRADAAAIEIDVSTTTKTAASGARGAEP